ncbi:hypothetical protein HH308_18980 [Gordonia sp. TBRC 11910]|uniref:Uncharacterized protein n=2 Tax=Gordonia asplenii TaxID=2725283 RepID=A0A848L3Y1_9ACTN|nr:hypothetical protein [Gordonia asplenii]
MTENFAAKRAARRYAREHHLSYRQALAALGAERAVAARFVHHAERILIEAVEGCGITHWCTVESWDGSSSTTITDLGGEQFTLSLDDVASAAATHFGAGATPSPLDIDSYLADEIVQTLLFGGIIYRPQVRRRRVA